MEANRSDLASARPNPTPVICFPASTCHDQNRAGRRSMEQRSRWRWISVVCFARPVALKFGDEAFQFLCRQVTQIALRQVGTALLKLGIFDEKICQKLHRFLSR